MPTEPPASPWVFPDPREAEDDVVAVGADLGPGTILSAYRAGLFPMPVDEVDAIAWWSPVHRGVIPLDGLRVTRSMRQAAKRFTITVDTQFDLVVRRCADPGRPGGWISAHIESAYAVLHDLGWAHSVEVWRDDELAGGLYGVSIGGLFAGESMFHARRDASKVALMALVDLIDDGDRRRLLDVQWATPHLVTLGAVEIRRSDYLALLTSALAAPLPSRWS